MRDEKGNITIKSIYKWFRSEKGKRYTFVIFYIFFFAFLFIFLSTPADTEPIRDKEPEEESSSLPFKTIKLENNDYNFTYQESVNNTSLIYKGEKKDKNITITFEDNTYNYYYQDGKLLLENAESPLKYSKLLDIYEIKNLIKSATFISKVEYPSKMVDYNYEISNKSLQEVFEVSEELSDVNNKIIINCNEDLEVLKISFDITNYYKEVNKEDKETNSYLIVISYGEEYEESNSN